MDRRCQRRPRSVLSVLVPFLVSLLLIGCEAGPSSDANLIQTEATLVRETRTVSVDNCNGPLVRPLLYSYPLAVGSVGVENLVPNGGEPFVSIRKRIEAMYGTQASGLLLLSAPPRTKREFTLTAMIVKYRGNVTGDAVEANKADPDREAVYFYPFLTSVVVSGAHDGLCP